MREAVERVARNDKRRYSSSVVAFCQGLLTMAPDALPTDIRADLSALIERTEKQRQDDIAHDGVDRPAVVSVRGLMDLLERHADAA